MGDRAVLYFWDEGKAIVLNPTGAVLWDALESPRTEPALCEILADRFPGLPAERARQDVAAFLARLVEENALRPVAPSSPSC